MKRNKPIKLKQAPDAQPALIDAAAYHAMIAGRKLGGVNRWRRTTKAQRIAAMRAVRAGGAT